MEMNNTKFMLHRAPCELSTRPLETLHMRIVTHSAPCELSTIATIGKTCYNALFV